ncbi:MAG: PepSY domain-containing protein [Clostridiales bacterium]|nr:PepSY domain-containing protein [Clostridiales bacterium]
MTDVGVNEADTTVTKAKLDFENGIFVYDIEFTAYAVNEYDYTIKVADGSVIDKDCDIDESLTVASSVAETYIQQTDIAETSQAEQTETLTAAVTDEQIDTTVAETSITVTTADTSSKYIGVDKAKSIALDDVGLSASDVTFIKAKLERDDGVYEYEIEFIYGDLEYEFEINASTGKIISYDCENIYDD